MTYKTNTPPSGGVNCLFVSETLSLLADEFGIVEVVDAHSLTNLIHRLGTNLAGLFRTLLKNIVNLRNILLELSTTLAHGLEELIKHLIQEFLTLHITEATTTVVILQFVKVLILWPELLEVLIT